MQISEDAAGLRASRNPFGVACSVAVPCWLDRAGALCTAASYLGKSATGEGSAAFAPSSVTSSPSGRVAALLRRLLTGALMRGRGEASSMLPLPSADPAAD
jgi:hypothetical protein